MPTINYDFTTEKTYKTPLSNRNQKFEEYINKYIASDMDMDSLISDESDTVVIQNLSELRSGIVSFYDFRKGASVLEIGASFGALTDILLRKCAQVTVTEKSAFRAEQINKRFSNDIRGEKLSIYVGDVIDMSFEHKFDYIILTGLIEKIGGGDSNLHIYASYVNKLKGLLKDDGVLLLSADNKLGLKYFSGNVDPYTNKAFSSVNNYVDGKATGRLFTRAELESITHLAGFQNVKFYYPLPDYRFPQLIYTDKYLPEKNLKERIIPYYFRKDTLVFDELSLYSEVAENGGFPFVANSFLLECTNDKNALSNIEYAAISTDRGRDYSFVTAIHEDKSVTKASIYPEGVKAVSRLYENTEDLLAHNIPVLNHERVDNTGLRMDFVNYPTLSNHIKDIIATKPDEVIEILDKIYDYILMSSETVGEGEDGPILQKAYMELIPLNCFWMNTNAEAGNGFLFFDQEYIKENCPAKYVLFRAIHYILCFTPGAGQYLSLEKLKDRYGMKNTWDTYLKMEREFLDEVRNHKKYAWFYKFAYADKNRIKENANRLASETEKKNDYVISDKMKKTWKVELQMLDEFDRICRKYNLTYYMVHGTLLGAVRHKGFIPWDDDLDVAMKRADYEKFVEVAEKELQSPLCLISPVSEKGYWFGPHYRIMNVNTTAITPHNLEREGRQGIYIDILPLDYSTEDEKLFAKKLRKLEKLHRLMLAKLYGNETSLKNAIRNKLLRFKFLSVFTTRERIWEKLNLVMQLYSDADSKDIAIFTGYSKLKVYNASDFASTTLLDFEGRKLPAPVDYKDYLFRSMGGDYMKFPPEEERKVKHRGIFDPSKPYTEYINMLAGTFKAAKGKQIILFGSGLMFEDYMKKYGDKYKPSFIVDNDQNKWERMRMGLEIKRPEAILEVPRNKRYVIICSYYYKEIVPQLEKMGITEYKVYVQEMDWILTSEEQAGEKHS